VRRYLRRDKYAPSANSEPALNAVEGAGSHGHTTNGFVPTARKRLIASRTILLAGKARGVTIDGVVGVRSGISIRDRRV
jgi:hypothetical protein